MQYHVPDREEIARLFGSLAATHSSPARRRRVGAAAIAALLVLLSAAGVGLVWRAEHHAAELTLEESIEVLRGTRDAGLRRAAIEAIRRRVVAAAELLQREVRGDDAMLRQHAQNALAGIHESSRR